MSRNEDVTTAIWVDPDFSELSSYAKLFFLWSFTNEHNGMSGLYKIGYPSMQLETGLNRTQVDAALAELAAGNFLSYVDQVMFVRSRVKRIRSKTSQIARSVAKDLEKLSPDHPQRLAFLRLYAMEDWLCEQLAVLAPENGWPESSWVSPKARAAVFQRDDYRCVDCGSTDDLTIDHILPQSAGGSGRVENLATRCRGCNTRKGVSLPQKPINTEPLKEPPIEVPLSGSGLSSSEQRQTTEGKSNLGKIVSELFAYWQQRCGHGHAKLTPERRRAIESRLKQKYSPEQIRQAIDGAAVGAHVSDAGKRFDDIELICRTGSKLESFIERAKASPVVESSRDYLARVGAA